MIVYLIRHAHAGSRGSGPRDRYRPLSEKGFRRADQLAGMLTDTAISRIVSSPATRCTQTVAPLATMLGLEVEEHETLWEGSSIDDVLDLLETHREGDLAACSHGDVIPELLESLARAGTVLRGDACEKGSIWVLERDGSSWTSGCYVPKSSTTLC
jgi:phosphohistidine phosphatase SixA